MVEAFQHTHTDYRTVIQLFVELIVIDMPRT